MLNDFTLERANNFIKNNNINKTFYPKLNFAAPVGWINDPNGVIMYKNELHLFYQHYPYDTIHGKMHWGHAKSKDGLNWEHLDIALAPDQPYDKDGVFSGSAIEKDGKMYLMYTGHVLNEKGEIREYQNIAISDDGVDFEKYEDNPVIDENDIPEGSSITDFRDPKIFEKDDQYYMVIGSKTNKNKGQVLLYESDNLLEWEYVSTILPHNNFLGEMVECPDLLFFKNKDVFLLSAMNYTDKETDKFYPHISWIIEGNIDWTTFTFETESIRKMDGGFDYYAPQTALVSSNPNEYVTIAWQQAWNRTMPSHEENHQWTGQMTIPRILKQENGVITQKAYSGITSEIVYYQIEDELNLSENYKTELNGEYLEFEMNFSDQIELLLANSKDENIRIKFDGLNQIIVFNRKDTIAIRNHDTEELYDEITYPISVSDKSWKIKIFIDTSSVQLFVNDYYTLSSTFYSEKNLDLLSFSGIKGSKLNNMKYGYLNIQDMD